MGGWNKGLNREQSAKLREEIIAERLKLPNKTCSNCKLEKPKSEFNPNKTQLDGYRSRCRECDRQKANEWHFANRDYALEGMKEYGLLHKEEKSLYWSEYYLDNIERLTEKRIDYYYEHQEEILAKRRTEEANAANRERARKRWRENPEKYREIVRRQQAERNYLSQISPLSYDDIYIRDEGICYLCYEYVDRSKTHYDHVIPIVDGGGHTYENVRITHATCNLKKGSKIVIPGAYATAPNPLFEQRFLLLCEEHSHLIPKK